VAHQRALSPKPFVAGRAWTLPANHRFVDPLSKYDAIVVTIDDWDSEQYAFSEPTRDGIAFVFAEPRRHSITVAISEPTRDGIAFVFAEPRHHRITVAFCEPSTVVDFVVFAEPARLSIAVFIGQSVPDADCIIKPARDAVAVDVFEPR
jgi:hypothetical protein